MSNDINALRLLQILEQESDENHLLSMSELVLKMRANGASPGFDRRRVYSLVEALRACGYDISTHQENKKGYYLCTRLLEDSEIQFLMDSVATSKSIPKRQRKGLIEKLGNLHKLKFKNIYTQVEIMAEDFVQNPELFWNIEQVGEAITRRRQLVLSSCNFGSDKKLHANYEGKRYCVNPYKMVVQNQKYYLICNYEGFEGLSHIRLDRMMQVEVLDTPAKTAKVDLKHYMTAHPFMYSGEVIRAQLRVNKNILGDVLDTFGTQVFLANDDNNTVEATVKANRQALCYWAIQYGTECEVIGPPELRETVAEMAESIAAKYR